MNQPYETQNAVYFGRNKWILALCAVPLGAGLLGALVALILQQPVVGVFSVYAMLGGLFGFLYTRFKNPRAVRLKAAVRAGSAGIQIDSEAALPFVPRSQIREGFVLPREAGAARVRLIRRKLQPPLELAIESEAEGRRLLRALGLDASQTVASFRLISRVFAHRAWMIGVMVFMFANMAMFGFISKWTHSPFPFVTVGAIVYAFFVVLMALPTRFEVGADGVLIKWAGRKRFVPHDDIESITKFERGFGQSRVRGLTLTLRTGERIQVPVTRRRWDEDQLKIIDERIREAMDSQEQGGADAEAMLQSRRERPIGDWITTLRSIGTGANADHREAPIAPERLWRVVEDPRAKAMARAAAAVALSAAIDDEGRARLKAAAGATAAPKLRIALEAAAADAEEMALQEALGEIEAAEAKPLAVKAG